MQDITEAARAPAEQGRMPRVNAGTSKTVVDGGAARVSAREGWTDTTRDAFIAACSSWRDDPARSLERLRVFLEGWAHATVVELDTDFDPYERGSLRRRPLGEMLDRACRHLPADRADLARLGKGLGDLFHHNQGVLQTTDPETAQGSLLHATALLKWFYRDVVRQAPPGQVMHAITSLQSMPPTPSGRLEHRPTGGLRSFVRLALLVLFSGVIASIIVESRSPEKPAGTPGADASRPEPNPVSAAGKSPPPSVAPPHGTTGGAVAEAPAKRDSECEPRGCWFVATSFQQAGSDQAKERFNDLKNDGFKVKWVPFGNGVLLNCGPYDSPDERDAEVVRCNRLFPNDHPYVTNKPDHPWGL